MEGKLPILEFDDPVRALRGNPGVNLFGKLEDTNWRDVQQAWRKDCYIAEYSHMPDVHIEGPDALEFLSDLSANTFEGYEPGEAKQCVMCNEDGFVIGDGVLMRLSEDAFRFQNVAAWPIYRAEQGDYDMTINVVETCIFQVQGPKSLYVLEEITDDELRDIDFMDFKEITIDGHDIHVVRAGMSGEVGFELHGPYEIRDELEQTVLAAGQEYNIRNLQGRTRLINHLEMGLSQAGLHYLPAIFDADMRDYREWLAKFDEGREWAEWRNYNSNYAIEGSFDADDVSAWYRTPMDLGWNRIVNFDHDFVGREALEAEYDDPPRTTVTLEWNREDVVDVYNSLFEQGLHHRYMEMPYEPRRTMVADDVRRDGDHVGVSTGRGYSYHYRKMLSLCVIDQKYADPGTEVTLLWGEGEQPLNPGSQPNEQKEIRATVAPAPYKESRWRTDLSEL